MNITKNPDRNLKYGENSDAFNLAAFVLSAIINNSENSYDTTEVIAAVNNNPDFLIKTIEHISRSNCMGQLAKAIGGETGFHGTFHSGESMRTLLDNFRLRTATELKT